MRVLPKFPPRLPASAHERLRIRPKEKVVAWGAGPGADVTVASYVAATDRALYVEASGERITWDRISKASWDEPLLELVLLDDSGRPGGLRQLRIDDAKDLPPAVHDRVVDSVMVSEHVDLAGGAGAQLVARRGSDDGEVHWSVVFDAGLDPRDPRLRQAADAALAEFRSALGI